MCGWREAVGHHRAGGEENIGQSVKAAWWQIREQPLDSEISVFFLLQPPPHFPSGQPAAPAARLLGLQRGAGTAEFLAHLFRFSPPQHQLYQELRELLC